jgi:uncharacterized protein YwqG
MSWLGGTPDADAPRGLTLLACIDLAGLHRESPVEWLPSGGCLLFYYDVERQAGGFDPNDRSGFEVAWNPEKRTLAHDCVSTVKGISFRAIDSYPDFDDLADLGLELTDTESEIYSNLRDSVYSSLPEHQLAGWPKSIQGPMDLECQLVSNGIYCGGPAGYKDPRAEALRAGAAEWKLLLQLDSDRELDWMWGDMGKLYFLIRESDARNRDFTKAWCVLQCY